MSEREPQRGHSRNLTYVLPKDALEGNRLDLQHRIFQYALQGNFDAPLEQGVANILDVGCGTGIWGREVALDFPDARIVSLDIDPAVQSDPASTSTVPALNHHFVQSNILEGLPFPDDVFDFTHQRMLVLAIPTRSWPNVLRELIRVTRPDGWIELLEMGGTFNNAGPATTQLTNWVVAMGARRGIDFELMEQLGRMAEEAGLRETELRRLDLPLGSWDPDVGELLEKNLLYAFEGFKPIICQVFNITGADYASTVEAARAEWTNNRVTCRYHLVCGRA